MKCTCPGLAIDKMKYEEVKDRCTVRWSVVVQCRYWATLYVLEYLIGARYMKCNCPGLTMGKMKYQDVKDRCTCKVECRSTVQILGNIVCPIVPARCTLYEVYLSRISDR